MYTVNKGATTIFSVGDLVFNTRPILAKHHSSSVSIEQGGCNGKLVFEKWAA